MLTFTLTGSALVAQTQPDSSAAREQQRRRTTPEFVDANGDGFDDRLAGPGSEKRRGKDRFIDEDGDGICDSRATGLGFRRRGAGAGSMTGAEGKGRMRHSVSGGKP